MLEQISKKEDDKKEDDAAQILEAGIEAAMPSAILSRILRKRGGRGNITIGKNTVIKTNRYRAVRIVSFGKAGLSMAAAFDEIIRVRDGVIVIPKGMQQTSKKSKFQVVTATHPTPSKDSLKAARAIISFIQKCNKNDLVVFLVSGGGSSLIAMPDGVTLDEKIKTNELLLATSADITEINCVRKHISKIKGGQLVAGLPCDAIALLMSDVKANDMTSIASGTTYCDRTTFSDALKVIRKYKLENKIPRAVITHLQAGVRRKIPETPKNASIRNFVIASNKNCTSAMRKKAESLGYSVKTTTVFGKVEEQAKTLVKMAPTKNGSCLIFGGETTVLIKGNGAGGRNQELVLRIADRIHRDIIVGSIGTDGIDGNTEYAGAMIRTSDIDKSKIAVYLKTSNSNAYFKRFGGLIKTGHTQTNLLDIGIMLS